MTTSKKAAQKTQSRYVQGIFVSCISVLYLDVFLSANFGCMYVLVGCISPYPVFDVWRTEVE